MGARSAHSRNLRALIAIGVTAATLVAGCSGSSSGAKPADVNSSDQPKNPTLVITANDIAGGKNSNEANWISKTLIPDFVKAEAAKGITAHVTFRPNGVDDNSYKSKLALDLQSGTGDDVFSLDGIWVGEFADAGYLKPLNQVAGAQVDNWDGWSQITQAVQALGEYQGQRYGVPNGTDARVIFYNKKLFAQAGLPADWQPTSWQDVYDAAAKLKTLPGVTPVQWDAGVPMGEATTMQGFLPLLAGANGTLWANGKWVKAGPAFTAALGFYQKIYGGGYGDPVLQEDAKGRDESFAEFAADKIGIYAESDYMWRSVVNPSGGTAPMADRDTDVGYALIPSETAGSGIKGQSFVSYSGGSDWSINPKTKYPQAAWDFLAFLNSKTETISRIAGAPLLTARTDVNQQVLATDPMLKFATDKVLPITSFRPSQAAYNDVSSLVQKATADVVSGKSPADAAAAYEKALEALVGPDSIAAGN
ncbi:extracellular solute-binding protein [Catenulispora pinisilvae]|uniref:extracellular solute-binding protein n=1 Tax=Catenulispora pinisilvae TaxID=2705253 RepID=UPI001891BCC7|nr:extracellular solute-binding protein [Catenulispora pinisilvae]